MKSIKPGSGSLVLGMIGSVFSIIIGIVWIVFSNIMNRVTIDGQCMGGFCYDGLPGLGGGQGGSFSIRTTGIGNIFPWLGLIPIALGIGLFIYSYRQYKSKDRMAILDIVDQPAKTTVSRQRTEGSERNIDQAYCPYCGARVETGYQFCPKCGRALNSKHE